jgi:hypothetical protein
MYIMLYLREEIKHGACMINPVCLAGLTIIVFDTHNEVHFAVVPLAGGWLIVSCHWTYTGKSWKVCHLKLRFVLAY